MMPIWKKTKQSYTLKYIAFPSSFDLAKHTFVCIIGRILATLPLAPSLFVVDNDDFGIFGGHFYDDDDDGVGLVLVDIPLGQ